MNAKQIAAEKAVELVKDGMIVGLGTGSTATWAIQQLGQKVKNGLNIQGIATSIRSEALAREVGIPITTFAQTQTIDLAIDGADEVDTGLNLIKGGGGSLLREKMVASASKTFIVIVDESKLVAKLGRFPLPVEVTPFGWETTNKRIQALNGVTRLRFKEDKPYVTDNGNYILDCSFGVIYEPETLYNQLKLILGVVEVGLFLQMATNVIVAYNDGSVKIL